MTKDVVPTLVTGTQCFCPKMKLLPKVDHRSISIHVKRYVYPYKGLAMGLSACVAQRM